MEDMFDMFWKQLMKLRTIYMANKKTPVFVKVTQQQVNQIDFKVPQ